MAIRTRAVRLKERNSAQELSVKSSETEEEKTSFPERQPETPRNISTEELNRFHTDDSYFPSAVE